MMWVVFIYWHVLSASTHALLAAYYTRRMRMSDALYHSRAMMIQSPYDMSMYDIRAYALATSGDLDGAIAILDTCIAQFPQYNVARHNRQIYIDARDMNAQSQP